MTRKKIGYVLAEGEATGHAHRVAVDVFEGPQATREFEGATSVTHEEHRVLELPANDWTSGQAREYDHFAEETRAVQD